MGKGTYAERGRYYTTCPQAPIVCVWWTLCANGGQQLLSFEDRCLSMKYTFGKKECLLKTVKVCDSIMGSGKTSAAIRMMNEERNKRFIFITPFLAEADRIAEECESRGFTVPVKVKGRKQECLHQLLREKRNVSTTHALFLDSTEETIRLIEEGGYTLVLDEVLELFESKDISEDDVNLLQIGGVIEIKENGSVVWLNEEYDGVFADYKEMALTGELYYINDRLMFYSYPADVLKAFEEVYVLTYMFAAQTQRYYFDMRGIGYEYIGTKKLPDGGYIFTERAEVPEYARHLKEKIHIVDSEKMNSVGNGKYALSMRQFQERAEPEAVEQIKKNLLNYFQAISGSKASDRLWATYSVSKDNLQGRYGQSFLSFNSRATNSYRDKTCLAYLVNVFMNPFEYNFFTAQGVQPDQDGYALSVMVQWIWRSAIREGKDIEIYIPSKRMRDLLIAWCDRLEKGEMR